MLVWNHRIDHIYIYKYIYDIYTYIFIYLASNDQRSQVPGLDLNVPFKMFKAVSEVGVPVHMP